MAAERLAADARDMVVNEIQFEIMAFMKIIEYPKGEEILAGMEWSDEVPSEEMRVG